LSQYDVPLISATRLHGNRGWIGGGHCGGGQCIVNLDRSRIPIFELVVINHSKNDHGYCYYRLKAVKRRQDPGRIERTCDQPLR
jgi:hypothetical protein